jgi:hypothetical protein
VALAEHPHVAVLVEDDVRLAPGGDLHRRDAPAVELLVEGVGQLDESLARLLVLYVRCRLDLAVGFHVWF